MFLGLLRWEKAKHLQTFWIRHHFDWTVVPGNGVKVDAKMFRLSGRDSIGLVNWCSILKEGWSDSHPLHLVFANGISIYKRKVCACTSSIGHINTIAMDAYYMYGQRGSPFHAPMQIEPFLLIATTQSTKQKQFILLCLLRSGSRCIYKGLLF